MPVCDNKDLFAGVDVGNSTTEAALAQWEDGVLQYLGTGIAETTGIKGTPENVDGVRNALLSALEESDRSLNDVSAIYINAAIPVIGDLSMSTITETIITESAMIGHNPDTPGGAGIGTGRTISLEGMLNCMPGEKVIPVVDTHLTFHQAAKFINKALDAGVDVQAAIVQENEGVLISNRIKKKIPIVDEVTIIDAVPIGMQAVVEVAEAGRSIMVLSNPYGIASLLGLDAKATRKIAPLAISLIGNRSAVVIKTPKGGIKQKKIPIGSLNVVGKKYSQEIDLSKGAGELVMAIEKMAPIIDIVGAPGTAVGGLINRIKQTLSELENQSISDIRIRDLFATNAVVPQLISGGVAGEFSLNAAIGLAAMVVSNERMSRSLVQQLKVKLGVDVSVGGTEMEMALLGALTTPGVEKPLAVVDMGGGSIDAAVMDKNGRVKAVHMAGAGDMVTMLIDRELGLEDIVLAEEMKITPAAQVKSLFHLQLEDDRPIFFNTPLDKKYYGRVVLLKPRDQLQPVKREISLQKLVATRRDAKKKVFIPNILRALKRISPGRNIHAIEQIVLIGGCALDFELPEIISDVLMKDFGVVTGSGNVRGKLGPRNAVATGLISAQEVY